MEHDPGGDDRTLSRESEQAAAGSDIGPGVLDLDHVYTALAHPRRRYLCYTLLEDAEWTLTDLAVKLAAWEHGVNEADVTDEQRTRVYVSLYHSHVPKLVAQDVIAFDDVTETISAADNAEQVLAALQGIGATLDIRQEEHARGRTE